MRRFLQIPQSIRPLEILGDGTLQQLKQCFVLAPLAFSGLLLVSAPDAVSIQVTLA